MLINVNKIGKSKILHKSIDEKVIEYMSNKDNIKIFI